MRNLNARLERLEEIFVPEGNARNCVIQYAEGTTQEEIEAIEAALAASGTRVFMLTPKDGTEPELHVIMRVTNAHGPP